MPSAYAHLQFGRQSLPRLPERVSSLAQRFCRLYDVGLQGPDLFFYYDPVFKTEVGALGHKLHMQSGKEFFGNAVRAFHRAPTDGARAYLYGVLGHYCLDSVCHPYICEISKQGRIGHTEMETEFDRLLMERDGIAIPHLHRLIFRLNREENDTVAGFYSQVSRRAIRHCMANVQMVGRLTTTKHRKAAKILLGFGGKTGLEMLMPETQNEKCMETDRVLTDLFDRALLRYPILTEQLTAAMEENIPLGEDFASCFG